MMFWLFWFGAGLVSAIAVSRWDYYDDKKLNEALGVFVMVFMLGPIGIIGVAVAVLVRWLRDIKLIVPKWPAPLLKATLFRGINGDS